MKLTDQTFFVLKTLASINNTVLLRKGKLQRASSPGVTVIVDANLVEDFPVDFGVYDMSQFLAVLSTMKDPVLEFGDSIVNIKDDTGFDVTYRECAKNLISNPSQEDIDGLLANKVAGMEFVISDTVLGKVLKLASINSLSHVSLIDDGTAFTLQALTLGNDLSNNVVVNLGASLGKVKKFNFPVENLNFASDTYDVSISDSGFGIFVAKNKDLRYIVATERKKG
jgi:hypothetical protein